MWQQLRHKSVAVLCYDSILATARVYCSMCGVLLACKLSFGCRYGVFLAVAVASLAAGQPIPLQIQSAVVRCVTRSAPVTME
jgi:hypothetical protein